MVGRAAHTTCRTQPTGERFDSRPAWARDVTNIPLPRRPPPRPTANDDLPVRRGLMLARLKVHELPDSACCRSSAVPGFHRRSGREQETMSGTEQRAQDRRLQSTEISNYLSQTHRKYFGRGAG